MSNPWPITPLGPNDLNFAVVNYDFTTLTGTELDPLPELDSTLSSLLDDAITSVSQQGTLFDTPDMDLSDMAVIPNEQASDNFDGSVSTLGQSASDGDTLLDKYIQFVGDTPNGSGGGGGSSGGSTPSTDCSQRTNQYGLSKAGTFPGVHCDWPMTFQVLRVQDGPCTYSAAPAAGPGANSLPKVLSFTLISGDATVWKLGHHTAQASDGTPFDVVDVTVTPKAQGHYDGVGLLQITQPNRTLHVCMSVDFIP